MHNVVEDYPRFSLKIARKLVVTQQLLYDEYDITNDQCTRELLCNSISQDLLLDLHSRMKDDDPFPVAWMIFIGGIRPSGITIFEGLKDSIRARQAHQYPGENISLLVKAYLEDAKELEKTSQYSV